MTFTHLLLTTKQAEQKHSNQKTANHVQDGGMKKGKNVFLNQA
jgi:hypothetical protein